MRGAELRNRFGSIAIQKGFITKDQFIKAMAIQVGIDLEGAEPKLIGSVLCEMEYMTEEQVDEVIKDLPEPVIFKCPNCRVLIENCPNCGIDLR
ncbi:hypothetical protein ACFL0H_13495 [Thermodesulfobacteriota bacterium]